jgi:hypothetical protein
MPTIKKSLGYGAGSCRCAEKHLGQAQELPDSTKSVFDLTLDHVHEFGQKVHVSNIRELEAAEKRLGFQSVVLNSDAQNFDDPPQQKPVDFASVHRWKFGSERQYRENQERRR